MIEHQKKSKYKKLDILFMDMTRDVRKKKVTNSYLHQKYSKDIEALVKKLFKVKINMKLIDSASPAYTMPSPVVASNTFISVDLREALKNTTGTEESSKRTAKVLKVLKKNPGTIDEKNATIGGGFSKIPSLVVLNYTLLTNRLNFSYEESLASFFHEIGHVYTYFANAYRINSTNLFMLEASTTIKKAGPNFNIKEVTAKIKMEADKAGLTHEELDDLGSTDSRSIYGLQVARMMGDMAKSDIGDAAIDGLEAERAADAFVTRLGYGRHLASAVVKINVPGIEYDRTGKRVLMASVRTTKWSLASFVMSVVLIAFLIPMFIVVALFLIIYSIIRAIMAGILSVLTLGRIVNHNDKDEVYDLLPDRINKIYLSTVKLLKDVNLDKREKMDIITDLSYMKEMMNDLDQENISTTLYQDFSMILTYPLRTPSVKAKLNEYMNKLEVLSSNDLYVTSAQLSIL